MSLLQLAEQDDGLERMKKNGPQDVCYACLYDKEDIPYIQKLMLKPELIDYFYAKCEQKYNDHHSAILEVGNHKVEFLQVSKADDVVTFPGLSSCMQQILGSIVVRFKFMIAGTDNSQARPYQQSLLGEVTPRIDMTLPGNGSLTRSGQALRYLGIFSASFPTASVKESGVSNASPGGILLNRNAFSGAPIAHTVGVTGFTLASLITFSAVTTWA